MLDMDQWHIDAVFCEGCFRKAGLCLLSLGTKPSSISISALETENIYSSTSQDPSLLLQNPRVI